MKKVKPSVYKMLHERLESCVLRWYLQARGYSKNLLKARARHACIIAGINRCQRQSDFSARKKYTILKTAA